MPYLLNLRNVYTDRNICLEAFGLKYIEHRYKTKEKHSIRQIIFRDQSPHPKSSISLRSFFVGRPEPFSLLIFTLKKAAACFSVFSIEGE